MPRKALIRIRRGPEPDIGVLDTGELGFCTDTKKLYIGTDSGNVLLVAAQTVGDMLKSIYDTDNDGKVDVAETAESVPWTGVSGKPSSYTPSTHTHTKSQITDFPASLPANGGNADTLGGKGPSDFATAAQGVKADNALPLAGGTMTGKPTFPQSGASTASLRMIPGTADPTTPQDGDIWMWSASIGARINGSTTVLYHSGNLATVSQAEAEGGTATTARAWTAQRVAQAIAARAMPKGPVTWNQLKGV